MNFKQLTHHFRDELLDAYPADEGLAMCYLAAEHVFGFKKSILLLKGNEEVHVDNLKQMKGVLEGLKSGIPLQYLLGEADFFGLRFIVSNSVLIPRPETEELVEWIIESENLRLAEGGESSMLDVGTGSGCIAIALKKNLKHINMHAMDVSNEALDIAARNSVLNSAAVDFIQGDILSYQSDEQYDLIVSNPPYITLKEKKEMHNNVLSHEPHVALFVSDEDPLLFYKAIADFALSNLKNGGRLFFEINDFFGKQTIEMLAYKGLKDIILRKDMQGKDRMICGTR